MSLPLSRFERIRSWCTDYRGDQRGAAGVEFALVLTVLVIPMLSVTDLGVYVYQAMELNNAAQAAAEAALVTCGGNANNAPQIPATTACAGFSAAVTAAAHSTSLGNAVTISPSPTEGLYCVNGSNNLALVGTYPPTGACSSYGAAYAGNAEQPGDYVQVRTSFTYKPLFTGVTLGSLLPATITRTAWMRIGYSS